MAEKPISYEQKVRRTILRLFWHEQRDASFKPYVTFALAVALVVIAIMQKDAGKEGSLANYLACASLLFLAWTTRHWIARIVSLTDGIYRKDYLQKHGVAVDPATKPANLGPQEVARQIVGKGALLRSSASAPKKALLRPARHDQTTHDNLLRAVSSEEKEHQDATVS